MGWLTITPITPEAKARFDAVEKRYVHPDDPGPEGFEFLYLTRMPVGYSIVGQVGGDDERSSRVDMSRAYREPVYQEVEVWGRKR